MGTDLEKQEPQPLDPGRAIDIGKSDPTDTVQKIVSDQVCDKQGIIGPKEDCVAT